MLESLNLRNTEIVTLLKNIAENVCFKVMLYFMLHGLQFFSVPYPSYIVLQALYLLSALILFHYTKYIYLTQINVVVKIMQFIFFLLRGGVYLNH